MRDVRLDYAVPPADLAGYVTLFYRLRADGPHFADIERADYAQLRFLLSGKEGTYRMPDGVSLPACAVQLLGPTSGAMQVSVAGPVDLFGAGITAAGWAALVGAEASTVLNRALDAEHFYGARIAGVADRLRAAADIHAMADVLSTVIRVLAQNGAGEAARFIAIVEAWLEDSPSLDTDALVAAVGLSRRQVERRCKAVYGLPPKMLARKVRALRAAAALCTDGTTTDDVLGEGFYDQSHLIREVKQFTGLTPRQIQAAPDRLAKLAMPGRGSGAAATTRL